MKKNLATYLVFLSLVCVGFASCSKSEDEAVVELSPYALVKSFSLGNIRSAYPSFTETGKDTTTVMTMTMEDFPFTIDQLTGEIFNNDSLPFATNVTKVVTYLSVEGVPALYVDSIGDYVAYSNSDSIDFTSPRKLRVYSSDAQYYKDYTITVNVHQLNPDQMVWDRTAAIENVTPVRAVEHDGHMCLFGTKENTPVVAMTPIEGEPQWVVMGVDGLPETVDLTTVNSFNKMLYVIAEGCLYSSSDAVVWAPVPAPLLADKDLVAILASSDDAGEMVVANAGELFSTKDGVSFVYSGDVPSGLPLYGVSAISYPLSHNGDIIRYMAVGYDSPAKDGKAKVWSRISNEEEWVDYENAGNPYACPSLKGLAVVRFDKFLYAMGGAGSANGRDVGAFASFYISKDNGITWKVPADFYQVMPEGLSGNDAPFAVTVDSNNFMWIINADNTWKAIINRLGFKK